MADELLKGRPQISEDDLYFNVSPEGFRLWQMVCLGGVVIETTPINPSDWIKTFHYIRTNNGDWVRQESFISHTDEGILIKVLCNNEWHWLKMDKALTKVTVLNHPEGFEGEGVIEGLGGNTLPCYLCMLRLQDNIKDNEVNSITVTDSISFEVSGFGDADPKQIIMSVEITTEK